jgi:hypothetical protein
MILSRLTDPVNETAISSENGASASKVPHSAFFRLSALRLLARRILAIFISALVLDPSASWPGYRSQRRAP